MHRCRCLALERPARGPRLSGAGWERKTGRPRTAGWPAWSCLPPTTRYLPRRRVVRRPCRLAATGAADLGAVAAVRPAAGPALLHAGVAPAACSPRGSFSSSGHLEILLGTAAAKTREAKAPPPAPT